MCKKHCDMLGEKSKISNNMGIPIVIIQNMHMCKQETRRQHTENQLRSADKRASGGASATGSDKELGLGSAMAGILPPHLLEVTSWANSHL